jgi:hypothetical protein
LLHDLVYRVQNEINQILNIQNASELSSHARKREDSKSRKKSGTADAMDVDIIEEETHMESESNFTVGNTGYVRTGILRLFL